MISHRYVLTIHSPVMDLSCSTEVNPSATVPKDIHCAGILPEPTQSPGPTVDVVKRHMELEPTGKYVRWQNR